MAHPPYYFRRHNFTDDKLRGLDFDESKVDAELNDIARSLNAVLKRERGYTTAAGGLTNLTSATAESLSGSWTGTATAGQTAFTTDIEWVAAFSSDNVAVYADGERVNPGSVSVADDGSGFLEVTISAQTNGTVVVVDAFEPGSAILTRLADSVTVDEGATLVGVRDAGGLYDAADVEAALAEVMTDLNTLISNLGTLSNYLKKDGTVVPTANLPMGGFKLTGLAAGTADGHSVRYEQLQDVAAQLSGLTSTFLAKSGGTMSGDIDMGGNTVTNLDTPVADDDAATKEYVDDQLASFGGLPVGTIIDYAGTSIPTGWVNCDGSAVARTGTYANLFAAVGVAYGAGDGVTTFNLPDCQGRATIGVGSGSGLSTRSLGDTGGEEEHVLTIAEMPAHTHSAPRYSDTGSNHWGDGGGSSGTSSTNSTGGDGAHENMMPFIAFRKLIKY